ncbi:MAG: hypothetical protein JNL01_16850 [Bdellovibrionales bacterium]|nr:hypothetical protein [Bdellovibrionales bacterium]
MTYKQILSGLSIVLISAALGAGCSSGPEVKKQAYASSPNFRTFEYELPVVWKASLRALKDNKIVDREPEDDNPVELKKLTEASLETDWIYSQSRDKYHEYKVNGSPRRKALQVRLKYKLSLKTTMGGTEVKVGLKEELERLKEDGSSRGYDSVEDPDSGRAAEILDRIGAGILSAPNI